MFENMKVRVQLGLGFGIALLAMISVAGLGIWGMKASNDQLTDIVNDNMRKIELVNTMSESVHIVSRVIRSMLLLDDLASIKEEGAKLTAAREAYDNAVAELEKTAASERGQAIRTKIREAAAVARPLNNKIIELAEANRDEEARTILLKEAGPAVRKWQDALDENTAFQKENNIKQAAEANDAYSRASTIMVIVSIIGVLVSLLVAYLITRNLMRQLGGEPAHVTEITQRVANGDLTVKIETVPGDNSSMLFAFKGMVEKLTSIITDVRSGADSLASASEEISATAQSLSQSSSEQAAGVEETTASVEQMTASIEQNTENAKVTDSMASKSAKEATEGGEAVRSTVEAMKKIAGKIGIVDDIAYQTNLLALNAAIEAARAGEHGKGFAVVAAEVRKLAERSQVAAQEIGELAGSSVTMAERAGKLLDEMVPSISKTSDLVQEIASASSEQSTGVAQINSAMGQLNQTTQQNASASEELAATAEEMSSQSENLQHIMTFFKLADNGMQSVAGTRSGARGKSSVAAKKSSSKAATNEQDFERF